MMQARKYRKKPVVIEAYQTDKELDIETLEGTMHASVGDYIITGVRGEQYPCKPDIFEQTYEPADTPASPWQMVEEPPKEHMWCFVYTDEPEMIMPIRIAFYVASCTGKGHWYHYESGEDIDDEVDYWTPMYLEGPDVDKDLPWPIEPPKEDA